MLKANEGETSSRKTPNDTAPCCSPQLPVPGRLIGGVAFVKAGMLHKRSQELIVGHEIASCSGASILEVCMAQTHKPFKSSATFGEACMPLACGQEECSKPNHLECLRGTKLQGSTSFNSSWLCLAAICWFVSLTYWGQLQAAWQLCWWSPRNKRGTVWIVGSFVPSMSLDPTVAG